MSGAKENLVRRAPVCVLALAALAATRLYAGEARVVIYDAAEHQASAVSTGNVFSVSGAWDLSACGQFEIAFEPPPEGTPWTYFSVTMENAGARPPDANGSGSAGLFTMNVFLEKQDSVATRPIPPPMPALQAAVSRMDRVAAEGLFAQVWPSRYWTYKDAGWGNTIKAWSLDPSNAVVKVSVANLGGGTPPRVRRIVATGPANRAAHEPAFAKVPSDGFFPFVDRYGQFRWKDWPGKIGSDEDLAAAKAAEDADLAAHPGPAGRDRWGGWEDGPKFEATGHFHVRKVRGKWWFVDPDGRLWWSHGPVRVSASCGMTPYKGREGHFEFLPDAGSPFAAFYQTRDALLWPYYVKRGVTNTYDFTASNLYRKYGDDWRRVWAERVHRRLRSWGANTIANSSDAGVMALSRTPYCDRIELKSRPIEATVSHGTWWPFRDPFDPSFREGLRRQLQEHKAQLDDPWCFGFFVDNELGWGGEGDMARWVWESPAEQPARIEFARRLAAKYGRVPADPPKEDLKAFSLAVIEEYFRSVRDEFKKIAPQKLYMGCRFSGGLDESVKRISAKYCDVMSFNYYDRDVLAFSPLPAGIDPPGARLAGEPGGAARRLLPIPRKRAARPAHRRRALAPVLRRRADGSLRRGELPDRLGGRLRHSVSGDDRRRQVGRREHVRLGAGARRGRRRCRVLISAAAVRHSRRRPSLSRHCSPCSAPQGARRYATRTTATCRGPKHVRGKPSRLSRSR